MVEIELMGPTRVSCGGTALTGRGLGGSKQRQVLEILAIELGTPVSKDSLAERLWDHRPPRSYIATLESYVCGLRRRLNDLSAGFEILRTTMGGYVLDPSRVRVDVAGIRHDLDSPDLSVLEGTFGVRVDTLLADDPYAPWANQERERLSSERGRAYVAAAHRANELGDHDRAVRLARAANMERSWSEPATQELMEGLARTGNHAQALLAYQSLRTVMREELGVEPSPATRSIYMSILCHDEPEPTYDVAILSKLLRNALESATGRIDIGGPGMAELGRMLLARA